MCISVFLFISTSIVQTLKLHLGNKKIAILLRPHSGDQCDSYPTTLYRPWNTLWRKGALIKTGKLPHISTKTRRAGKSLQMMSVQSSPDESSCWWAGWLMPAGSRGPPPEHCHRRCNTSQSDTAKVLYHERRRSRTIFHGSKSATLPSVAATSHRGASSVPFLTSRHHIHFRHFAGQSTLNKLALRSAHTHTPQRRRLPLCTTLKFRFERHGNLPATAGPSAYCESRLSNKRFRPGVCWEGGGDSASGRWITKAG